MTTRRGPRPQGPRLCDLEPETFARETAEAFRARARPVAVALLGARRVGAELAVDAMPAYAELRLLCRYAQTGDEVPAIAEAVATGDLIFALLEAPLGSPLGIVLAAAEGRLALAAREPIGILGLAALTGLHPQRVRALAAQGVLRRFGGRAGNPIERANALTFLREQNVPGFSMT